ncbi:hypothetical protein L916_04076 [Phytophthora nicotianae]|nr:hypothetical protein L916_04076 [Phytophthora nicotianae]
MDQYGCGQPVQYSLLETNSDWHMSKCLDHFKRANEQWRLVRIVIVDKDMKEVEVIRQKLPEARVLLCHFHVIKWLQETIRKSSKYGAFEGDVLSQLKHTITNMTYARSEEEYEVHRTEFKNSSLRGGRRELWDYFEKNWDKYKEMWVMTYRKDLPHFNNHTNNRVESLFSKVKQHLKDHHTMNASLRALLSFQRRKEEAYYAKVEMPGTLRDTTYSEEMNIVLGMTTRWVASAISSQYDIALDPEFASSYTQVDNGATVTFRREAHEYLLLKETFKCDCEFSQTMQLPCRHAIMWRKTSGSPFVIPFSAIGSRWYGRNRISIQGLSEVAKPFVAKIFKQDTAVTARDQTEQEKYRRAQQAFGRISGELAQFNDAAFNEAITKFERWWQNLRQGQTSMALQEQTHSCNHDGSKDSIDASTDEKTDGAKDTSGTICGEGSPTSEESENVPLTQKTVVETEQPASGAELPVEIKLNSRVIPVGRPRLNRKEQRAKAKADLKEYNQGMKLRGLLRDRDVCEVVSTLKEIQPGIREVGAFLATFQVLGKATAKQSMVWRPNANYVADNVRYRLPEQTVDRALDLLRKLSCGKMEEIQLDSEGEEISDANGYVLVIEKIGTYTREQSLVNEPVDVSVAFDDLLKTWPYLPIPGFGFDVAEADLFCVRGNTWLNDATMRAFCVFLDTYKNNTTVTIPPVKKQALKKPVKAEPIIADQQLQQIHSGLTSRQYLLMPINLSGAHWVCLVIDGISKKIELYDSMGSAMYLKRLKAIADEIVAALPDAYEEITVNGPLQHDGDSCDVLVCLQLWKCVSAEAPSDVTKSGITKLRWKILQGILKVKRRL